MTTVSLYWNHVCVLHNEEKRFLTKVQQALREQDIDLQIRFFGLGYPCHMASYMAQEDAVLPDMVISTDLEMFELPLHFARLGALHACESWLPLKDIPFAQALKRKPTLLPFVGIPLVCFTTDLAHCQQKTLADMAQCEGFTFGGIHNSAGKTIAKVTWQEYGMDTLQQLLANANIENMPIAAFQAVRQGRAVTALVPSLYAMRADGVHTHQLTLKEGALMLPSYFACRKSVSEDVGKTVMHAIINETLCQIYANQGNLFICPAIETHTKVETQLEKVIAVKQDFLDTADLETFYQVYENRFQTR